MEKDTVVYIHRRNDTGEVFYVGIGNEKRPYKKERRTKHWKSIVNKHGYTIEILKTDLTWEEACEEEINLIKLYGRKDLGLGTLVNMTDGGEGCNGFKHSEETKKKISREGSIHTEKTKEIMSINRKGQKNINSKLTKEDILWIRNNHIPKSRIFGSKALSKKFNVSYTCIQKIVYKKTWTHI
jgi:hypothetical protein